MALRETDQRSGSAEKTYLLITNVVASTTTENEIDLHAEAWKLPYSIDDSDLTFDGKPLNMLHEENRWTAEHVSSGQPVHEHQWESGRSNTPRGRSRHTNK